MTEGLKGARLRLQMNAIYLATEGEGVHVGTPQVFVRFQGCAIGCLNCDSKDTWEFSERFEMQLETILKKVSTLSSQGKIKRVSITGGDPLHPQHVPGLLLLIKELKAKGYFINLEAAGTRVVDEVFDLIDFISFDYKTPCTGVKTSLKLLKRFVEHYPERFQIKSVVQTQDDFTWAYKAKSWLAEQLPEQDIPWCLTPAYNLGEPFPKERFDSVMNWNMEQGAPFRVVGQQHKWLYGPDRKEV